VGRALKLPAGATPGGTRHAAPAAVAAAAIAIAVFQGALAYGFSQDDFLGLGRALGLAPRLTGWWRPLSHQWFYDALVATAGLHARSFHAVSLAIHALAAALLGALLARRFAAPAALAGAAFFAAHAALYTAVYWIAANGDLLATLLALAATACFFGVPPRLRWLALPCFALSLLAKESTLSLPFAIAALAAWGPPPRRPVRALGRDPVWLGLVALSVAGLAAFALRDPFAARAAADANLAYALAPAALGRNLLTYGGWTANTWLPTVAGFGDAVDPRVFGWARWLAVTILAGAFVPALRARGWIACWAGFALMLLPVLPLANHTYHYYLAPALPFAAAALAAALDAAFNAARSRPAFDATRARPAIGWVVAAAIAGCFAVNGVVLVHKIESMPLTPQVPALRSDPTVDRARIASNAVAALAAAGLPAHASITFWSPASVVIERERVGPAFDPALETYWERNVRAALLDGFAVRVMVPAIDSTRFVHVFSATPDSARWAVYRPDGTLDVMTAREIAAKLAAAR